MTYSHSQATRIAGQTLIIVPLFAFVLAGCTTTGGKSFSFFGSTPASTSTAQVDAPNAAQTAEWAKRFFQHFLVGESLGQAFLDLRREFFYQHNNVMGLLYALYCDGDTQVVPGLQVG